MKILLGIILFLFVTVVLPYILFFKWPPAKVKYDDYYKGYYISAPGILDRQVHCYGGDFYLATGGFDRNYIYSKQVVDSLFIEYKRWLKAGH